MKIVQAKRSEIDWINKCYDEVGFIHSTFEKEVIAIAEVNGQKAGLGRLVTVEGNNLELGGMYVFEPFRGQGIATKIVAFLLEHVKSFQTIYCIPFEHLVPFYQKCGFVSCSDYEAVPKEISDKCCWCKKTYSQPTALLVLSKSFKKGSV